MKQQDLFSPPDTGSLTITEDELIAAGGELRDAVLKKEPWARKLMTSEYVWEFRRDNLNMVVRCSWRKK